MIALRVVTGMPIWTITLIDPFPAPIMFHASNLNEQSVRTVTVVGLWYNQHSATYPTRLVANTTILKVIPRFVAIRVRIMALRHN
jgi:hypothetical protein